MSTERFCYEYVWVNRGEWRSGTDYGKAIDEALRAARNAGFINYGTADGFNTEFTIKRTMCDDAHLDLCFHADVIITKWAA